VLEVRLRCPRLPHRISFAEERGRSTDVLTGDERFDDAVEAQGDPTVLAALLDGTVRVQIRRLVAWEGSLKDGVLSWGTRVALTPGEIPRMLVELGDLADVLTAPRGGVCERLAQNAREDTSSGIRLWNLSLLQQQFAQQQETWEASRTLLADADPWVRLAAARFLAEEGTAVLRQLLTDARTPDQAAAEAVVRLVDLLPPDQAGRDLLAAVKGRTGEARRQAMLQLGRLKYTSAVGPLCVLLARADPRTAATAAQALGTIGDAEAEAHLVDAVKHEAAELRVAAARALGALGTVDAVAPLLELLEQSRDSESRRELRAAVSAIQSRLPGAAVGQLSLKRAEPEAGRLSLATARAGPGDVSLATGAAPARVTTRQGKPPTGSRA
jgi:HEAT repeat protein